VHTFPFFFLFMLTTIKKAFSFMVNADRVKKKIPSLLADSDTSKRKNYNAFFRERYRLQQFKKRNPEKCDTLTNKIIADLNELEKAVNT